MLKRRESFNQSPTSFQSPSFTLGSMPFSSYFPSWYCFHVLHSVSNYLRLQENTTSLLTWYSTQYLTLSLLFIFVKKCIFVVMNIIKIYALLKTHIKKIILQLMSWPFQFTKIAKSPVYCILCKCSSSMCVCGHIIAALLQDKAYSPHSDNWKQILFRKDHSWKQCSHLNVFFFFPSSYCLVIDDMI